MPDPAEPPPHGGGPSHPDLPDDTDSEGVAGARPLPDLFSTDNIFERLVRVAEHEIEERPSELVWAGIAAGLCITLSFAGMIHLGVFAGPDNRVVTGLLYPLGFLFIVLGRYQLFTENTLTPVALILTRRYSIPDLLRLWSIVLVCNLIGAVIGGSALVWSGVLDAEAAESARHIAEHAMGHGALVAFWKAVVAGWLVAGMTWIVHGVTSATGRILVISIFIYAVAAFDLVHCIAGTAEATYAVLTGVAGPAHVLLHYLLPAIAGNTIGGVVLVALLNYAQTRDERRGLGPRLDLQTWLLGSGRGQE